MNGDMRRAVTELQAAKSSNKGLAVQLKSSLDEYNKILNKLQNKNKNILGELHELLYQGRTVREICVGLHDAIISSDMESIAKFKYLRTVGESEWRSQTMTPKVLLSWMVGQLI